MSARIVSGPSVVVPARVAYVLARRLPLAEMRLAARGVDPELAEVLTAIHALAASYRGEPERPEPPRRRLEGPLTTMHVAIWAGCTTRAVTQAVADGRLTGTRIGRAWTFDAADVRVWLEARAA